MFERDIELTKRMIDVKRRKGFPNKFRAAYAKNSGERVFQVSKMLNDAGMSKGATLSFQSMDANTLDIVKRKNIGIETYRSLMKRYRAEGIPTYSELIIGLPGETYDSFADGIDTLIENGAHQSINCYLCECLPNSELSEPAYRERHGIRSVTTPVLFYHGTPTEKDENQEEYELIVETATLPPDDWLKCMRFSWIVQAYHCLGFSQKVAVFCRSHLGMTYRQFYELLLSWLDRNPQLFMAEVCQEATNLFRGIPEGRDWGIIDQRFGNIVWPVEEGSFLKLVANDLSFVELDRFVVNLLGNATLANDVVNYQRASLKMPYQSKQTVEFELVYNIHEVVEGQYVGDKVELKQEARRYQVEWEADWTGDLEKYARLGVWFERKGGKTSWDIKSVPIYPEAP